MANAPHDAALADEAVSPERDDDGMSWARTTQVTADDGAAGDDGLASEDNVLRTCDGRATGHFVPSVLRDASSEAISVFLILTGMVA